MYRIAAVRVKVCVDLDYTPARPLARLLVARIAPQLSAEQFLRNRTLEHTFSTYKAMLQLVLSMVALAVCMTVTCASTTIPRPPASGRRWGEDAAAALLVTVPSRVVRSVTPSVQVKQIPPPPEASDHYLPHTTPEYQMIPRRASYRLLWALPEHVPTRPMILSRNVRRAPLGVADIVI
ncbi:hypothetical protein B566_EDAN006564 [Ephemera danica]|nr:hypothetical protein B566_EDAN006564 [Ephemera danica]